MSNLKWGLAGYGNLADKRVASALRNAVGSELKAVWGRDPQRTRDFALRHGIGQACDSLEQMLAGDIDAVYICTPTDSHTEYALAAIALGKHVLVEKPMASTVAECERIINAAIEKRVTLGVAYYRRAYPKMQEVKWLIEGGLIGTPTWVNIAAHSWYAPAADDPQHWRVEKERSRGGAIVDIGVHRLDLLDYWLGESDVLFANQQHLVQEYEVEDASSAVLQLQGGAPVHTYFAWNSKTWIDRFEIVGSEGKLIIEPLDGPGLTIVRGRERENLEIAPPENAHLPCVEDFVRAVHTGRLPLCDGAAGLRATRLLERILSPSG